MTCATTRSRWEKNGKPQSKRDTTAGTIFSRKIGGEGTSIKPMQGKIKSSVIQFRSSQHLDARKGPHSQTGAQTPKSGGFNFASITNATSPPFLITSPPQISVHIFQETGVCFPLVFSAPALLLPSCIWMEKSGWMLDDNKERHKARIV